MNVLWIVRMRASRHRWPNYAQAGITEALKSNPCRVVANHCVVPHQLKKLSSAFCRRFEFRLVREFFQQTFLSFRGTLHELFSKFRKTSRIHPVQSGNELILRLVSQLNGVLCVSYIPLRAYRHAIRHHEINELRYTRVFRARSFIARNNHVRQILDHLELLPREEKRLVRASRRTRNSRRGFVYVILRACERPFFEPRKRPRNSCNSDVSQNLSPFYPLPAHLHLPALLFAAASSLESCTAPKQVSNLIPFLRHLHLSLWQPFPAVPRLIGAAWKSGPCTIGQCLIKDAASHAEGRAP